VIVPDVWTAVGTAVYLAWQVTPLILIWRLRTHDSLSVPGTCVAAIVAVLGTAASYYVALTDSSSTAPLLLLFSPLYLMGAVLIVFGVDFTIRASRRRRSAGARRA
jgi:hypothetical protein